MFLVETYNAFKENDNNFDHIVLYYGFIFDEYK